MIAYHNVELNIAKDFAHFVINPWKTVGTSMWGCSFASRLWDKVESIGVGCESILQFCFAFCMEVSGAGSRNEVIWGGHRAREVQEILGAWDYLKEWTIARSCEDSTTQVSHLNHISSWKPPPRIWCYYSTMLQVIARFTKL